jgi:large subunit ribosomal protein L22e
MISKKEDAKDAKQKTYKKYTVDFNSPVDNNLLTLESALKYMQSNMKINGLKGKLGNTIKISITGKKDKNKNTLIVSVDSQLQFSKRYIRYLVKKFLKREGIARFLTVSSTSPNAYTVKVIKKNEA